MKQTESLNLKKPEATDLYNIEDQNANADILDGAIGNLPNLTTTAKDNLVAAINEVITEVADKADQSTNSGGFVGGSDATATTGSAMGKGATTSLGSAAGTIAKSTTGGAAGNGAETTVGAAVGSRSKSERGAAVGAGSKTSDGIAGGLNAKTIDADGNGIDAVQLGTGTNNTPKTMQVYGKRIVEADGSLTDIGALSDLTTIAKDNLVKAINETKKDAADATEASDIIAEYVIEHESRIATNTAAGHVKVGGKFGGSSLDKLSPLYASKTVTNLNDTALLCTGEYRITFKGDATGVPAGLEAATTYSGIMRVYNQVTGTVSTSITVGCKRILILPLISKTYEQYCYNGAATYGDWVEVGGANITATENDTNHTLLICDSAQLIDDTVTDTIVIGRDAGGGGNNTVVIGSLAGSDDGGATVIGQGAYALEAGGIAVGHNAKADKAYAIQLGEGINNNPNTFQVCNYQLLDAEGNIPAERLKNAVPEVIDLGDTTADITELLTDERINALIPSVPEQVIEYRIKYLYYGERPIIGRLYAGMYSAATSRPDIWYQVYIPITNTDNPRTLVRTADNDSGFVWHEWTDITPKQPRTATVIVAASNADDRSKAGVDYVCTGTDDNTVIQRAIDSLPSCGGTVYLTEGTFTTASETITLKSNVTIKGAGKGATVLKKTGTGYWEVFTAPTNSTNVTICNLTADDLSDASGAFINMTSVSKLTVTNVGFNGGYFIKITHSNNITVDKCDVYVAFDLFALTTIKNATITGCKMESDNCLFSGTGSKNVIFTDNNPVHTESGIGTCGTDIYVYNNLMLNTSMSAQTGVSYNMDGGSGNWNRVISS